MKTMPVSTQSGVSTNTGATVAYTAAITILLAVLYAAQSIAVTNSKTNGIYNYDPNSAVMATEFMKLILATSLLALAIQRAKTGEGEPPKYDITDRTIIAKFAVPAFIYMLGNNILYLALRYLDAPTYQILGNLKIVVVAIVQRGMLRSTKTLVQWLGVTLLMLGMMVIASGKLSATSVGTAMEQEKAKSDLFLGLFFMVLISLASAFAGVYTEFLLKRVDYSTDFQNILLYAWGVVFCLLGHVFQPASLGHGGDGSFFGGFEAKVWLVVVINAFLGQVVSRVMKYADNITKVFASSSGVIITAILSRYLFAFELTLPFCLGTTVVVVACMLYFMELDMLAVKY